MTAEKFKELSETHILVSIGESIMIYAIERKILDQKGIFNIGKEPGLNVEAYMIEPFKLEHASTLCTDDLSVITHVDPRDSSRITRVPLTKYRSKH